MTRLALFVGILVLAWPMLTSPADAQAESELGLAELRTRLEAVRDHGSEDERPLAEQGLAALDAATGADRDEAGRARARAIAEAALALLDARARARTAVRAVGEAEAARERAITRRDQARAREAAARGDVARLTPTDDAGRAPSP